MTAADDLAGKRRQGAVSASTRAARSTLAGNPSYDVDAVTVLDRAHVRATGLVEKSAWPTATVREVHRHDAPGHDPGRLRDRAGASFPAPTTAGSFRRQSSGTATRPSTAAPPQLLYGYGALRVAFQEPDSNQTLPSLFDRGIIYAHAPTLPQQQRGRLALVAGRAPRARAAHLRPASKQIAEQRLAAKLSRRGAGSTTVA